MKGLTVRLQSWSDVSAVLASDRSDDARRPLVLPTDTRDAITFKPDISPNFEIFSLVLSPAPQSNSKHHVLVEISSPRNDQMFLPVQRSVDTGSV